jgi:hypothetical protein
LRKPQSFGVCIGGVFVINWLTFPLLLWRVFLDVDESGVALCDNFPQGSQRVISLRTRPDTSFGHLANKVPFLFAQWAKWLPVSHLVLRVYQNQLLLKLFVLMTAVI